MAQFARPISDVTLNAFTNEGGSSTNLYLSIDETTSNLADYIKSPPNTTGYYECGLSSVTDPNSSSEHIVRYIAKRSRTNKALTLVTRLMQGTTLIASQTLTDTQLDTTNVQSFTLSSAEADSITDYTNLLLEFDITVNGGGGMYGTIYWAELEVPDAGVTNEGEATISVSSALTAVSRFVPYKPTLISPTDTGEVADTTPSFTFSTSDYNGDELEYEIDIFYDTGIELLLQQSDQVAPFNQEFVYFNPYNGRLYSCGRYSYIYSINPETSLCYEEYAFSKTWGGISANSSNGDIYACVQNGDIYKQTAGTGDFVALGQTTRQWRGISVNSSNGDVYATVDNGDIYKQTGGMGDFTALGETARQWFGISVNPSNGDIYACVFNGDIYKQTAGSGSFAPLGETVRYWTGISVNSSNGDVYATVYSGDIYKQTAGSGSFAPLGQTSRSWNSISVNSSNGDVYAGYYYTHSYCKQAGGSGEFIFFPKIINSISFEKISANSSNGDVYACVAGGDIYKQTGGIGDFVALSAGMRQWYGISVNSSNGDVYACVQNGDIYKQTAGTGDFVALGQTTRQWTGISVNSSNGDVYATVFNGDIYKQTAGSGSFAPLGETVRYWTGISVNSSNGDVYACVYSSGGGVFKQTSGSGTFTLVFSNPSVTDVCVDSYNNNAYACLGGGNIYKQTSGVGSFSSMGTLMPMWNCLYCYNNKLYAVESIYLYKTSPFYRHVIDDTSINNSYFENITTPTNTHPFNSGDTIQYTVQAGNALTSGSTYYWRVRAIDP